jgi:hypothetical protein
VPGGNGSNFPSADPGDADPDDVDLGLGRDDIRAPGSFVRLVRELFGKRELAQMRSVGRPE